MFRIERQFIVGLHVPEREVPMRVANDVRHYSRQSLISMMVTVVIAITVNHLYSLGASAFVLGAALLLIPAALLGRFTSTASRLALIGYVAMNLWMIVGFGLVKGLWESTLRVFLSYR
jgi:hypothetical protein